MHRLLKIGRLSIPGITVTCILIILCGCSSSLVERTTGKRSILVEPEVYEYSFEVATYTTYSRTFVFYLENLLPRRRISENWEWTNIPMPLFKYRILNYPLFELGLAGGLPFIPFLSVSNNFSNDSSSTAGALPSAARLGFEAKLRPSELLYLKLVELNQLNFGNARGDINFIQGTIGIQSWKENSIEFGIKHLIPTQTDSKILRHELGFFVGPQITSLRNVHLFPYYEYSIPLRKKQGSVSYSLFGTSISWFW